MPIRRTVRLAAAARVVLGIVFIAAVSLDPDHLPVARGAIYWLLNGYLAWALLMAVIAWRSWWWDFRLAPIAHGIDMTVFVVAVIEAETGHAYSASPFVGFTAFLLVNALARWGRRAVWATGITLLLGFGLAGGLLMLTTAKISAYQFARRIWNMAALSLLMGWFGSDVRVPLIESMPEPEGIPGERREAVITSALAFARDTFAATHAALVLSPHDGDDQPLALRLDASGVTSLAVEPDAVPGGVCDRVDAMLFDRIAARRIEMSDERRLEAFTGHSSNALAQACGASSGLLARLPVSAGDGLLLVWGRPVVGVDDLPVMRELARTFAQALDREELAMLAQSIAVANVRNALARDLHDSAAQFLAGTLFRLEGLRRHIRRGGDPDPEIVSMREALRREQQQLRAIIDRLRQGLTAERTVDIVAEMGNLMDHLADEWSIHTCLDAPGQAIRASVAIAHELRLLVREAVANAVRHGQCSRVELTLAQAADGELMVSIHDDGKGFDKGPAMPHPRSISERIAAMGGRLRVDSCPAGVKLDIALPLDQAA